MRKIGRTVKTGAAKNMGGVCGAFLLLPLVFFTAGCAKAPSSQAEFVMGTVCTVNLYNRGTPALYRKVFARLRELEGIMSANREDSDVALINRNAGIGPVAVREELVEVLAAALDYAERSGGAFDPTVGPLVKLWGIGGENPRIPGDAEIREALALINWRDLLVDRAAGTAFLKRPGMALDPGAIAKGYAADEAARLLREAGIPGAIIDLGGNIFAYGRKTGEGLGRNEPWRIGIQDPLADRGVYIGILEIRSQSVVTSGVYERFFEAEGKRYHHILSVQDGRPVDNGLLSVTIIADHSTDADALSTAAFALGYAQGRALVESVPGAEAVFVFADKSLRITPGALEAFTLRDETYRILTSSISKTRKVLPGMAPFPAPWSP
ncbi:MAG: FAD:protein FMN transferase [Treponema sp.]|jgi:thiamine biosynthesis lipoprotein|nr:FAD:protein FMN transferase [Treponema sp.]